MVASCQAWPPWARGTSPAALILSSAAINSSQLVGCAMPSLSNTALLAQIQLVEWTLTGAAIQLPSYFENFCSAAGTTASHFSCAARSFRSPSTPCWAQSRMSKPSICTAVGGSPDDTRAFSTVIAWVPPPPATGMSFQLMPLASRSFFSTVSAAASPPEVHQCSTSTSAAWIGPAASERAMAPATGNMNLRMINPPSCCDSPCCSRPRIIVAGQSGSLGILQIFAHEDLLDMRQMRAHRRARRLGVAATERLDDPLMVGDGHAILAAQAGMASEHVEH